MNINANYINQSFKGLWGSQIYTYGNDYDKVWTYRYHPFSDDTDEFISKIENDFNNEYKKENEEIGKDKNVAKHRIKIMCKLPFSSSDFSKFENNQDISPNKRLVIQTCIDDFDLKF